MVIPAPAFAAAQLLRGKEPGSIGQSRDLINGSRLSPG